MLLKQIALNFESPGTFLRAVAGYLRGSRPDTAVTNSVQLAGFLQTRASHVAQTSLYGYLRTRAGTSYPELFRNDDFIVSVNIAKWQVWVACLSDLAIYAGGLIQQRSSVDSIELRPLITAAVETVLDDQGDPPDAGPGFAAARAKAIRRIDITNWTAIGDNESAFAESPAALVRYAPVIDSLKELDSEIVMNSVRFRWQEVRRELRRGLDAEAVLRTTRSD